MSIITQMKKYIYLIHKEKINYDHPFNGKWRTEKRR